MGCRCITTAAVAWFILASNAFGQNWIEFVDETNTRLIADPSVGASDNQEKDYAWDDLDNDGDIDLICVRKQPFTTPGRRTNVLFMNEGIADGQAIDGVLVDRTALYASAATDGGQGFLDLTNDRDVAIADVNNDGWLDFVTVATLSDGLPKTISHPRVYMNLGEDGGGNWLGFRYEEERFPQIFTIPGNLAVAPRLCSIAMADLTNDGFPDIYVGDYDSSGVGGGNPEAANADVNDRLFINDGTGHFTDSNQTRMNSTMLLSAFAMASVIRDMNGDGVPDVIKDTALNAPRHVAVIYNNPNNIGFFNGFDVVDDNAPYHITVGDLNNDNRQDIVITDDGRDHYMLNQGNGADGFANFTRFDFIRASGTDGEFGGNSWIADMNNDGLNDVFITGVDVDIDQNCSRRTHLYRNLGNLPNVTLQEQGPVEPWQHPGTHDVAVFDLNGDGWLDLVAGHCAGTNVWINVPPFGISFSYPQGLPATVLPDTPTSFTVVASNMGFDPEPNTGRQFVSVDGGPFVESVMTQSSPNQYTANLPGAPCTSTVRFYFTVERTTGGTESDPPGNGSNFYSATSTNGTETVFSDTFETDTGAWSVTNDASVTTGGWERVDPIGTFFPDGSTTPAQPENDFGAGAEETQCYITQQYPGSGGSGGSDLDGGPTILTSQAFDLAGTDADITYARWAFSNDAGTANGDFLVTEINNGSGWVEVDSTGNTSGVWEAVSFRVSDFVTPSATVQVRFVASDSPNNSISEFGVDSFVVSRVICEQCLDAGDCDDGIACNGAEQCVDGACVAGVSPCVAPTSICDEVADECIECQGDGACDDGQFCNGSETCDNGTCVAGTPPCEAGLTCDEINDVCVGCLNDGDCDDGLFCNGQEVCDGEGNCQAATDSGVVNGTFDSPTGWTPDTAVGGSIAFVGQLDVTGPDENTGGYAFVSQSGIELGGSLLEFDLLSYTPDDTEAYDRPVFYLNGSFFGLNDDGTLGNEIPSPQNADFGNIDNTNGVAAPIHFAIDIDAIDGPGPHEIGFGVMSVDGQFGAGIASFDTVLPAPTAANPCPGMACNEGTDQCVECLNDDACDDGQFCNGAEQCNNGVCEAGTPPCELGLCDEVADTCPLALQPAAGDPVLGLTPAELARFEAGKLKFEQVLTDIDGLGPIFNQNSCGSCHDRAAIGGSGSILVTRFGAVDKDGFDPLDNFGGSLLQHSSLSGDCAEVIPPEANIVANRITPSTFGIGLIESIPDVDIMANEATPGVSGRAHLVFPLEAPGTPRVGRFGWKAQVATVLTFSGDASRNELGFTNRLIMVENDPNGVRAPDLIECDDVPDPEDGPEGGIPGNPHFIDRVTDFQRFLANPPQTPKSGMTGEVVFNTVGCADCHTPTYATGAAPEAALSGKIIKPYSDFLLHDMGALGDGIADGDADVTEMRTPALWGVALRTLLLHDGRVSSGSFDQLIRNAIAAHGVSGSEAAASAIAFGNASAADQAALVAFMGSLGRREFDFDNNNSVGPLDLSAFQVCYAGVGPYTPDDTCAIADADQDGDVDDDDLALFLSVYNGSQDDCNTNTIDDATDIATGAVDDCNFNGIPDVCDGPFNELTLFVQQLLAASPGELTPVCPRFDGNGDGLLDGRDVQPFTILLTSP